MMQDYPTPEEIEERYSILFHGAWGWKKGLSDALGYADASKLLRAMGKSPPPPLLLVTLELLEALPRRKWPERWAMLAKKADDEERKQKAAPGE